MSGDRLALFFNCQTSDVLSTLGVLAFHRAMLAELARDFDIYFLHNKLAADLASPVRGEWFFVKGFVNRSEAESLATGYGKKAIEICAHHFQPKSLDLPTVVFVFDLHLFDIAWKYGEKLRNTFASTVATGDAVVTMFQRTYFDVERFLRRPISNLFLLDAPLLNKPKLKRETSYAPSGKPPTYIFPAQFQIHKNHAGLIRGLRTYLNRGCEAKLVLTGSDFAPDKSPYRLELQRLVDALGLTDYVNIAGHVDEPTMQNFYDTLDGMIVGSLAEGGAYVPLEGIYAGLPVAVNDIPASRVHLDMVGGVAKYFDSTDIESTADAYDWLANVDRGGLAKQNDRAREALGALSWRQVADQMAHILYWVRGQRTRPLLSITPGSPHVNYSTIEAA